MKVPHSDFSVCVRLENRLSNINSWAAWSSSICNSQDEPITICITSFIIDFFLGDTERTTLFKICEYQLRNSTGMSRYPLSNSSCKLQLSRYARRISTQRKFPFAVLHSNLIVTIHDIPLKDSVALPLIQRRLGLTSFYINH